MNGKPHKMTTTPRVRVSHGGVKTGVLIVVVLLLLAGGTVYWAWNKHTGTRHALFGRIAFPEQVLLEDFQRPLDRDLTEQLVAFERTGASQFLDSKILKPYFDDLNTREMTVKGVELRSDQFPDRPELYRIVEDCAKILGIPKPRVYIADQPGPNVYTANLTDPIIVIHSSLLRSFKDPTELRFIIGHEMGHIRCRHVKWQTTLRSIVSTIRGTKLLPDEAALLPFLPLFKWSREAEMSADNAGLICCQDLKAAERALVRLTLNLDEQTVGKINVDTFLQQRQTEDLSKFSEVILYWQQLLQDHPFVADRILELRKYEKTRQYQHLWE